MENSFGIEKKLSAFFGGRCLSVINWQGFENGPTENGIMAGFQPTYYPVKVSGQQLIAYGNMATLLTLSAKMLQRVDLYDTEGYRYQIDWSNISAASGIFTGVMRRFDH